MKIVLANKYYFLKGGAERALFDMRDLLIRHGHEPVPFAMQDARNVQTEWSRFFVSPVDTSRVRFTLAGIRTAGRMIYSFEAKRKFAALLDAARPDLVHLHNIYHQISPSILSEAKKRGLPVVMTAHDYKLIAPNYSLFHDGAICERTKPHHFWRAVGHRCVKDSRIASALAATEMSLQSALGLWRNGIDLVIAPSRFVQALLAEYGIDENKIVHVPHFIEASSWIPAEGGNYALYVGRLSSEKGVDALIRAAANARDIPVHVVGTGPDEARLKNLAAEFGASNVVFRGFLDGSALRAEYAGARFVVVPSVWYEVFGLVVLEAYAAGKPVIVSQIGGLPELVKDGETGLYATAGDTKDLVEQMRALWDEPVLAAQMGRAGRARVERDFTPEEHYRRLMEACARAKNISEKKKAAR
jgi:glycosyltransferase involved in cell wall biosynthesis